MSGVLKGSSRTFHGWKVLFHGSYTRMVTNAVTRGVLGVVGGKRRYGAAFSAASGAQNARQY